MSCSELLSKVGLSLRTATLGKRRAFDRVIEENEQWMHEDIENIKQMCNQFRQRAAAPVSDEQQPKPLQPIALSSSQQPSAIAAQPASADSLVKVKSALADLQQRRERERAEKETAAQAAAATKQAELAAALIKEKEKQEALEAAEAQRRKEEEARSLAQAEQKRAAAALAAAEQAAEVERQRIAAAAAEKQARDEERKRVQAAQAAAAEQGRRIAEKQAAEAAAAEAAAVALAKQREEEQQAAARAAAAAAESARAKAAAVAAAAQSEREAATLAKEREVARLAAEVEEAQRASLEAREKRMREKFAQLGAQEKAKQQQQQQQIQQQQQQQQQQMEMPPPAHLPSHVSNAATPKGKHSSAQISPLRPPSGTSAAAAFPVPAVAAAAAPVPRNPADSYELSDVEIWSEDEEAEEARRASRKPLPREFDELGHEVERSDDGKLIPKWAWKGYLKQRLDQMQRAKMDPDLVFPPVDPASCDLEAIFAPITPLRKRKPRGRTSSAHWQKDRLNQKEADKYQTAMGYRR